MASASVAATFGNRDVDVVYAERYHEHDHDVNRYRYQVIPNGSRSRNVSHWLGTPDISADDNELLYNLALANGLIHKDIRAYHPEKKSESERLHAKMSTFKYEPARKHAQYVGYGKRKWIKRQTAARKAGIKIAPYKTREGVKKGDATGPRAGWRARKVAEDAKRYTKVVLKLRVPPGYDDVPGYDFEWAIAYRGQTVFAHSNRGFWLRAKLLQFSLPHDQCRVHYIGFNPRTDEIIPMYEDRLRNVEPPEPSSPVASPAAAAAAAAARPAPGWIVDLNESDVESEEDDLLDAEPEEKPEPPPPRRPWTPPPPPVPPPPVPPPPVPPRIGCKDGVTVTDGAHKGEAGFVIGIDGEDYIVKMRVTGQIAILMPNQVKKLEPDPPQLPPQLPPQPLPQPLPSQPGPSNQSGEDEEVYNEFEAEDSNDEVVGEDSDGESVDEGATITSLKSNGP